MDTAMIRYQNWCAHALPSAFAQELQDMASDSDRLHDSFYCDLEFGTAGLRGILGAGTNRMNIYVIRRATQAVAQYLLSTDLPKSVAIGYDSRIQSDEFAMEAACVLAANGIQVHLYPRLAPVPALSFAVRTLGCGLGICITASHNPSKYNGYKVYGSDGCQLTPEAAKEIVAILEHLDYFDGIRRLEPAKALDSGCLTYIPDTVLDAFVDTVYQQRVGSGEGIEKLKLVYTPLNGSGLECVTKLTKKLGIRNLTLVEEQKNPDGRFPTCPYPNPEMREAMELGLQYCDKVHPDILIGTDPDCDRCGTAVPDGKGGYRLITGNELGAILLDFICRSRIANGTMPEHPVAVTTIVSTDLVNAIAQNYGVELRRVLTGFKYIGEQIGILEAEGHPERYIFGFEESYGYLSGTHVRDKDGVNAVLLVCEAAAWYAKKGMTLGDAIDALCETYGFYRNGQRSFTFPGESGMSKIKALMDGLRTAPPAAVAGLSVTECTDYSAPATGLPASNVLEFRLEGGSKLMVRPSGTEPKIKAYLTALASTSQQADTLLSALAVEAETLLR